MPAKTWRTVTIAGKAGVPNDGSVGAVSVVATVGGISSQGQLSGRPDANTAGTLMGIYGGDDTQNTSFSSVLAVGADGTIQVQAETSAYLILDVQGYYTANTDGTAPGGLVPLNGTRIADTRSGQGVPKAQLAVNGSVDVQITGTAGVPAGASAVIVNLIAVNTTTKQGYMVPYATGASRPSSYLDYAASTPTSNQTTVALSSAGKITVYNSGTTTDLVVDVQAYFTAAGKGGAVFTPGSGRVFDSRASGQTSLAKNETRSIGVAGVAGVPVMGSGINAVVLTFTSLASNGGGNATVWADGTTKPGTTAINFDDGTIRTNTITVPLGSNGKIALWNNADITDYVINIQGWYTNPQTPVISCNGYANGTWLMTPPASPIACTITASTSGSSGETLGYSVDSPDAVTTSLSETGPTVVRLQIPTTQGLHEIDAFRSSGGDATADSSYSINIGTWTTAETTGFPSAGEVTHMEPYLFIQPSGLVTFPADAVFRFHVLDTTTNQETWTSAYTDQPTTQVLDGISSGVAAKWYATISGTSDPNGGTATLTTPMYEFTPSDHAAGVNEEDTTSELSGWTAEVVDTDGSTEQITPPPANLPQSGNGGNYPAVPYCKPKDNQSKAVRTYERKGKGGVVKSGVAYLQCGAPRTYGMRHIWDGHGLQWEGIVNKYPTGVDAGSFLDQTLNSMFRKPGTVTHRTGNDSFNYTAPIQIKNRKGTVVRTYTMLASIGNMNWRVITAYPTN